MVRNINPSLHGQDLKDCEERGDDVIERRKTVVHRIDPRRGFHKLHVHEARIAPPVVVGATERLDVFIARSDVVCRVETLVDGLPRARRRRAPAVADPQI